MSDRVRQTRENESSNRTTTPTVDRPAICGDSASSEATAPSLVARIVPIHTVATTFGTVRDASANRAESADDQIHCPISVSCGSRGGDLHALTAKTIAQKNVFAAPRLRA